MGQSRKFGEASAEPVRGTNGKKGVWAGGHSDALAAVLSPREIETLRLSASGKTNRQIAKELMVSLSTVKTHVQRIIQKLGIPDRTQASVKAIEVGLLFSRTH